MSFHTAPPESLDPALIHICRTREGLPSWVIYADHPDSGEPYTAVLWVVFPRAEPRYELTGKTQKDVEAQIPGMAAGAWYYHERQPTDDPSIIGVWL